MYVLVDENLPPGQQLAQAVHAAFQLSVTFPAKIARWYRDSNYLVVLASGDLHRDTERVLDRCADSPVPHIYVVEPDYPNEPTTAVAFVPDESLARSLSSLPLALKRYPPM